MKNWKLPACWLLLISIFVFSGCDKYNSKITGKVVYIDANDNNTYPAAGAIVSKTIMEGDNSLTPIVSVIADINGEFLFDNTTKGTWILSGKLEKDSITYVGVSESFTTSGENQVEQNIMLKAEIKDDTE